MRTPARVTVERLLAVQETRAVVRKETHEVLDDVLAFHCEPHAP